MANVLNADGLREGCGHEAGLCGDQGGEAAVILRQLADSAGGVQPRPGKSIRCLARTEKPRTGGERLGLRFDDAAGA